VFKSHCHGHFDAVGCGWLEMDHADGCLGQWLGGQIARPTIVREDVALGSGNGRLRVLRNRITDVALVDALEERVEPSRNARTGGTRPKQVFLAGSNC
jgi:hypothetical protein